MSDFLVLRGLDAANPLAFLASLGALAYSTRTNPAARLGWCMGAGGWRPCIFGCGGDEAAFVDALFGAVSTSPTTAYLIDKRLPFPAPVFRTALQAAARAANPSDRRSADVLAGLGTDAYQDDKGNFVDTAFRMVRSGDAAGQGLPAYALAILKNTDEVAILQALFESWTYLDDDFSLRWDPIEDQRYALRWHDPSPQSNKKFGVRTMRGANALALEGLSLLPVQPTARGAKTTGFEALVRRREIFSWPIWEPPVQLDVVRSLLALSELQQRAPDRNDLRRRGIVEVYRSERIAPNQYYRNFSPAIPA